MSFETELQAPIVTVALEEALLAPRLQSFEAERAQPGPFSIARHGVEIPVSLGLDTAGSWTTLPDGRRLWRLRILSPGASSLNLRFEDFFLPEGARLFLYSDDQVHVLGAFTQQNNKAHGGFATDLTPGEAVTLEYEEPAAVAGQGRLQVATVVHGMLQHASSQGAGDSLPCSIDVACEEGAGWQNEINAVVKIVIGGGTCSGVLLNNTREDGTPYVLTANHCGGGEEGDIVNWAFVFNYESSTCGGPAPNSVSVSGAEVVAAEGGYNDFKLLRLSQAIPSEAQVQFAGWSIEGSTPGSGMVIGHPKGDTKKLTIDNDPIVNFSTAYWKASFDHGVIENASSGSPLFDESHKVVGFVRSFEFLDPDACSGPGGDDNRARVYFPKLSYIWNLGAEGERLSDFLDPDATGSTSVSPLAPPSPIWINEINASGSEAEADEFVEIVGPPGTNLNGYKLQVYACSGGTKTLQATHTLDNYVLGNDYKDFGIFVIGGSGLSDGLRDQSFGSSSLPNGSGLLVLKDNASQQLFDYRYDSGSNCPSSYTKRSTGDAAGASTMGFTSNTRPSSQETASAGLTATPGVQNFDGGQELPVELVEFEARLDGPIVALHWATASETNNAGFEIQRTSKHGDSGWEVLGYVDGAGTTLEAQRYTYQTASLQPGSHRFRLKQIDFDGTFEYSPEVEVTIGIPTAFSLSQAYPNPFNPETQFSLSVARAQQVEVAVYDPLGRRVAVLFDGLMDANSTRSMTFEAGNLPSGLYLIRVLGERFVESQVVTLLK